MPSTKVVLGACTLLATAVALGLAGARAHALEEQQATRARAEHVMHLLSYLDADCVRVGGKEQDEHLALAERAATLARDLPEPRGLEASIDGVRSLIRDGAPDGAVRARLGELRSELVASYGIERAPRTAPDLAQGRALYEEHCATCHGANGAADTPAAATLRPHPPSFQDSFFVGTLTPYDVTTAIRFGVDGTAMAPVAAIGTRERWDVAFYVLGLGRTARAAPTDEAPAPRYERAEAPCSEPGFSRGPELHAIDGGLPFEVTHDCMFPGRSRLEIAVNVAQRERPRRGQIDALLRALLEQVRRATSPSLPELVHVCAFPAGTVDGTGRYGCLELESDEGPSGELSVQIDLPFEASEWLPSFATGHPDGRVALNEAKGEVVVTIELPEEPRSAARAAVHAFPWIFDFYPPKTTTRALTVRAVHDGKAILAVHVADLDAFLAMNPWPIRERMAAAHVPLEPEAQRTPEQESMLEKEYGAALARLPRGSVEPLL
ncbi:MAG TPA: cytochrome c [Polyangiaceae bacterium]